LDEMENSDIREQEKLFLIFKQNMKWQSSKNLPST
jgi:hypothetical protein